MFTWDFVLAPHTAHLGVVNVEKGLPLISVYKIDLATEMVIANSAALGTPIKRQAIWHTCLMFSMGYIEY